MSRSGIKTFSRTLRYRKKTIQVRGGIEFSAIVGEEKGVDVRIAIDVIRLVRMAERHGRFVEHHPHCDGWTMVIVGDYLV
jgi:hypothetical protein